MFFILWCLYIVTQKDFKRNDVLKVAVLHSLAILFHQVNILFSLIIIYAVVINRKHLNVVNALGFYALIGFIITAGTYFIVGWIIEGNNSFPTWIYWMEGYTVNNHYWQAPGIKTPLHVLTGFSHAFIGGHYIFQLPAVEQYFQQSFQSHGLKDEFFFRGTCLLHWRGY